MYILTKIVIDKNAIHISFMKVFGYVEKEIKKLYLTPTTIVIFASLLFGLPLTYLNMLICFEAVFDKDKWVYTYLYSWIFICLDCSNWYGILFYN